MNILDKIIAQKRIEVAKRKAEVPAAELEKGPFFNSQTYSLRQSLLDESKTGIIAEFKRKSPSKGIINGSASVEEVTAAYAAGGASGISVLTDSEFFGGSLAASFFNNHTHVAMRTWASLALVMTIAPIAVWSLSLVRARRHRCSRSAHR